MVSEKYILLAFAKYLNFSERQKNSKLLMFRSDFRKKGVCSKSVTLYGNKFLVRKCILKLVCHCESCRLSEIGCAKRYR